MTVNTETLLDRLYNLRGADSDILKDMDRQRSKAEETKDRTTAEKSKLQSDISALKKKHEELQDQGEKFKEVLQGINRKDYETVLDQLHIDFNPDELLDKLENNLPKNIETVEKDTKRTEDELVKVEEEMNSAITSIDELGIRKDTALANQEKLNEYFDLALSGQINITRDSITSLLGEFGFNEEEQREAAKILMFPEDALYAYDDKVKQREKAGKSISEVIQEAKTISEEDKDIVEEPEEKPIIEETQEPEIQVITPVAEEVKEVHEDIDTTENTKEDVIATLKENGMDYLDFTSNEIDELIKNYNEELFNSNIHYMKEKGLDVDVFVNHASMIYDEELEKKVELLLSVGKEVLDIYLNPSILVKYSYEQLENSVNLLKNNGMNPKDVPLMAY